MSGSMDRQPDLAGLSDDELGARLTELGSQIAWPPAPGMASAVMTRLTRVNGQATARLPFRRPIRSLPRALLLAIVALLLAATIAVALGLGLPGIQIFFGPPPTAPTASVLPTVPTPIAPSALISPGSSAPATPSPATSPSPQSLGGSLHLGRLVSLAEARTLADFPIQLPSLPDLGAPAEVWVSGTGPSVMVSFAWPAGPAGPAAPGSNVGLLLSQFRGTVNPSMVSKWIGGDTTLEAVIVHNQAGFWISGAPHNVAFPVTGLGVHEDYFRLSGNVLMWTADGLTFRLETATGRDEAMRIAESVH